MNYLHYSAPELAADEYFQSWVLTEDAEVARYWNDWLRAHPYQQEVVAEAIQLLRLHQYKADEWPAERKHAVLERIRRSVSSHEQDLLNPSKFSRFLIPGIWTGIAATFGIVLIGALVWYVTFHPTVEYRTGYGETRQVTLPDGSTVLLNANSSLEFSENWQPADEREVWLEGEAFFEVTPVVFSSVTKPIKVCGTRWGIADRGEGYCF